MQEYGPPDYNEWELTFSDEFCGFGLSQYWQVESEAPTHILSSRWPENVEVRNENLKLMTKMEKRAGKQWTTGHLWTKGFTQKYGYFEAKIRITDVAGLNNAFWLMPEDKEFIIAIAECQFPDRIDMHINFMREGKSLQIIELQKAPFDLSQNFNVFGLEWDEKEMIWYLNGRVIHRERNPGCHNEVPVRFSTAVMKNADEITGTLSGTSMSIDWIRVYKKSKSHRQ